MTDRPEPAIHPGLRCGNLRDGRSEPRTRAGRLPLKRVHRTVFRALLPLASACRQEPWQSDVVSALLGLRFQPDPDRRCYHHGESTENPPLPPPPAAIKAWLTS